MSVRPRLPVLLGTGVAIACGSAGPPKGVPTVVVTVPQAVPTLPGSERDPLSPGLVAPRSKAPYAGTTWGGEGEQTDGQTWPMVLRVAEVSDGPCALVTYPGHAGRPEPCRAEWICTEEATDGHRVGVERLIAGFDSCIDGCAFDADLGIGIVEYACPEQDIRARAVLRRVSPGDLQGE